MDWLDLLAVQGTLKSLLQHHSSKASILQCSGFFTVQLSHPYMTTGKTIASTRWAIVDNVMFLLFNMLSRLVITFLPRISSVHMSILMPPLPSQFFKDSSSHQVEFHIQQTKKVVSWHEKSLGCFPPHPILSMWVT